MNARTTARIRTALPQVWAAVTIWILNRYTGVIPDDAGELVVIVWPAAGAVLYDIARTLEAGSSQFGKIIARAILGTLNPPAYTAQDGTTHT